MNAALLIVLLLLFFFVAGIGAVTWPTQFIHWCWNTNSSGCHIGYSRLVAKGGSVSSIEPNELELGNVTQKTKTWPTDSIVELEMNQNLFVARPLPRIPLGELTAFLDPLSCVNGGLGSGPGRRRQVHLCESLATDLCAGFETPLLQPYLVGFTAFWLLGLNPGFLQ